MQKSLVVGGVYHVQISNGRKYCLWNGTNLVPCKYISDYITLWKHTFNVEMISTIKQKYGVEFQFNNHHLFIFIQTGVVQNSEVQLSCSSIRIGTMVGQPHGQVKVKMDPPSGITFSVKSKLYFSADSELNVI